MRWFLQNAREEVQVKPGQPCIVEVNRPHLGTNEDTISLTFLIMQEVDTYDYVSRVKVIIKPITLRNLETSLIQAASRE